MGRTRDILSLIEILLIVRIFHLLVIRKFYLITKLIIECKIIVKNTTYILRIKIIAYLFVLNLNVIKTKDRTYNKINLMIK